MEVFKCVIKFVVNDEWGKVYCNMFGMVKMNQLFFIFIGVIVGVIEVIVVVFFEFVKICLQDKVFVGCYNGMIDCVVKIVCNEGILIFY